MAIRRPDRLGINGASNGGLLVLSCMLQRPELYGAVVAGVPVADMLRFKHFTFGSNWICEYGDSDKEPDFKTLRAYSPVHNVRARRQISAAAGAHRRQRRPRRAGACLQDRGDDAARLSGRRKPTSRSRNAPATASATR